MNPSLSLWQRLTRAGSTLAITQTATYYIAFIALGLTTASLGPTLLGLADQTHSALAQISYLFTARSFGYLIGSFMGGRWFDHLPGHRTMAIALLLIAIMLASVPLVPLLLILLVLLLGVGFMEAVVDVGANTLIVWVHRERVGPYMNGLHMFFAVGAFLSPLLIGQAILRSGNFGWGYWMLAILILPVIVIFLPLPNPPPIISHHEHAHARPNLALLVLICILFAAIAAAENSFGGWIFTYGVKTNLVTQEAALFLNSAFWGAFLLGRLASIPLAARLRPRVIILTDLLLAFFGILIMLVMPASSLALWVGTILFGLAIASAFPTLLTFAGRHMTITGAVTGWFFVGASIGSMTLPWLIGQLFESVSPASVVWVIGSALLIAILAFGFILMFLQRNETQ